MERHRAMAMKGDYGSNYSRMTVNSWLVKLERRLWQHLQHNDNEQLASTA